MVKDAHHSFPEADEFRFLILYDQQSTTQRYSVYGHGKQRKAGNVHI